LGEPPSAAEIRSQDHSAARASRTATRMAFIILTTNDLDQYVYAALSAGASGFLLKDVSPEQLVAAVRMVRSGDALLPPPGRATGRPRTGTG
jgi:DNA-binding NarL/FixJ family response regulator